MKTLRDFIPDRVFSWIRAWPLAAIAIVLAIVVLLGDMARVDNLLYGVLKVSALAYAGYWIDRWLFPYARPHDWWWDDPSKDPAVHEFEEPLTAEELEAAQGQPVITPIPQIRRAIIVAACILTATLMP